jgi:hypothetical protein
MIDGQGKTDKEFTVSEVKCYPIESPLIHKGFQCVFPGKNRRMRKSEFLLTRTPSDAMNSLRFSLLILLAAGLTSCTSPQHRIRKHQAVFDAFPPATQNRIRNGEIAIGDTKPMVRIAKGSPDTISVRQTEGTRVDIWRWTQAPHLIHSQPVYLTRQGGALPYVIDTTTLNSLEVLRVEFVDDKVVLIEEMQDE